MFRSPRARLTIAVLAVLLGTQVVWAALAEYQAAVKNEPSLLSYWTFDGDSPDTPPQMLADVAPNGVHRDALRGTGTTLETGIGGGLDLCMVQSGSGNSSAYVPDPKVSDYNFLDGTGTVEAWFYPNQTNTTERLFLGCNDSSTSNLVRYAIRIRGPADVSSPLPMRIVTAGISSAQKTVALVDLPPQVQNQTWHHLAVVFDGTQLRVYIDGQAQTVTYDQTGTGLDHLELGDNTEARFIMGSTNTSGSSRWLGRTDEVALYADALTEAQIQAHYAAFQSVPPPLTMTPDTGSFVLPSSPGPLDVTLALGSGTAGAGGLPVELTYDPMILAVATSGGTPIPTGGSAMIPASGTQVTVKVTAVNGGTSVLAAAAAGYLPVVGTFTADFAGLSMAPSATTFSPAETGPVDVTLSMVGPPAGVGGMPITLTYDPAVIAVATLGGTPIPSGGLTVIPQNGNQVGLRVTNTGGGYSALNAVPAAPEIVGTQGAFHSWQFPTSAYQQAVLDTPSLVSFWTFDGDSWTGAATGVVYDMAPVDPHHMNVPGGGAYLIYPGDAVTPRGKYLDQDGTGISAVALPRPAPDDYLFLDGTGTIEGWFQVTDATSRIYAAASTSGGSDPTRIRYAIRFRGSPDMPTALPMEVRTGNAWALADLPASVHANEWHHVAIVFEAPDDPAPAAGQGLRIYIDGAPLNVVYDTSTGLADHMVLGSLVTDVPFVLGSASETSGSNRFNGSTDDVAVYSDALTGAQLLAHYQAALPPGALAFTPAQHTFMLPPLPAPLPVTLALPAGMVAPAGGLPVVLNFNAEIHAVSLGAATLVPGGQVTIPAGANSLQLEVSPLSQGQGQLLAMAAGFGSATAELPVQVATGDGVVYVDDRFDDNPLGYSINDLSALGINLHGPGVGWNVYTAEKTQRERGTKWEVLADGGAWAEAVLSGKDEDEFSVMTTDGVSAEWTIDYAVVTVDNTVDQEQHPGGRTADSRHEFGIVSADLPNQGDNELYNNTRGGLYVNVYYQVNTSPEDLIVTGSVRAVNMTHAGGDAEGELGLETLGTFTLPGVTRIAPDAPLTVAIKASASGWEVAFSDHAQAQFTPGPGLAVQVIQGSRLIGGWNLASMADAEITTEFDRGAFLHTVFQNMAGGRGGASIDRIRACSGCALATDCANPFSDADHDGDTDQNDFALLQLCFTGSIGGIPQGCRCFDHNGNGNIDSEDVVAFVSCFSGPGVASDPGCDD